MSLNNNKITMKTMHTSGDRIQCAAIWYNDNKVHPHQPVNVESGFVLCGFRHGNCIANLTVFGMKSSSYEKHIQGFLTNTGHFVDRKEAMIIARRANQLLTNTSSNMLFSEDLY